MGPPTLGRLLVVVAALSTGAGGVALLLTSDRADGGVGFAVVAITISWSFIGTGLYAWWRRPDTRIGPLMAGVGFVWVINALTAADAPGVFIAGVLLSNLWLVLLFLLLLTFPSGRIRTPQASGCWQPARGRRDWCSSCRRCCSPTRRERDNCDGCPPNPLLISDNETLAQILFDVQAAVAIAAVVGLLVLVVRRWRAATPVQRGAFQPLLWAGGVDLALLVGPARDPGGQRLAGRGGRDLPACCCCRSCRSRSRS